MCSMHLSGFQLQNHYNGYNLRQLSAVVDALAEFHAVGTAMLVDSDHDGGGGGEEALVERFAKLLDSVESKINAKRRQHAGKHVGRFMKRHLLHTRYGNVILHT